MIEAMSRLIPFIKFCALAIAFAVPSFAEGMSAIARLKTNESSVKDVENGLELVLSLTQPVEWRAFTLAAPPRLVLDFREVDWRGARPETILGTTRATALRTGPFRPGWSRLVLDLAAPFAIHTAGMRTGQEDGSALIRVQLSSVEGAEFRARSGAPDLADWGTSGANIRAPKAGEGPVIVVLDPGHGGIDPGAEAGGLREADLTLTFARELQEALVRTGRFQVILTRDTDVFVSLDRRITFARAADADIFLSIHADALDVGRATGASIYTLSETASDEASAILAERHDYADLLAGVDLSSQDDVIADVLMDIARLDTQPRSEQMADALVEGFANSVGGLYKHPRLSAGFSVLRAPDIPSALIELGFISSAADRARLTSAEWRQNAAQGLAQALATWVDTDTVRATLLRR